MKNRLQLVNAKNDHSSHQATMARSSQNGAPTPVPNLEENCVLPRQRIEVRRRTYFGEKSCFGEAYRLKTTTTQGKGLL